MGAPAVSEVCEDVDDIHDESSDDETVVIGGERRDRAEYSGMGMFRFLHLTNHLAPSASILDVIRSCSLKGPEAHIFTSTSAHPTIHRFSRIQWMVFG